MGSFSYNLYKPLNITQMEKKLMGNSLRLPTHLSNTFRILSTRHSTYWLMSADFSCTQTSSPLLYQDQSREVHLHTRTIIGKSHILTFPSFLSLQLSPFLFLQHNYLQQEYYQMMQQISDKSHWSLKQGGILGLNTNKRALAL